MIVAFATWPCVEGLECTTIRVGAAAARLGAGAAFPSRTGAERLEYTTIRAGPAATGAGGGGADAGGDELTLVEGFDWRGAGPGRSAGVRTAPISTRAVVRAFRVGRRGVTSRPGGPGAGRAAACAGATAGGLGIVARVPARSVGAAGARTSIRGGVSALGAAWGAATCPIGERASAT